MRILFLTQVLPLPLDAGPKIRSYYTLRYLVEAGHEVTLASFRRPSDRAVDIEELARLCHKVKTVDLVRSRARDVGIGVQSLVSKQPFLIARDHVPAMHELIGELCEGGRFDAVHADQLWMAPYAERCDRAGRRVLDQHNAVYLAVRRLAEGDRNILRRALVSNEAAKLERFERQTCQRFDSVAWVSDVDRLALSRGASADPVIPIATDPLGLKPVTSSRRFRITFLGGMHWPPNAEGIRWFAESIWPQIASADASAVLTVIGKGAPKEIGRLQPDHRVDVTGYVDDIQPYLEETAVFIVPLLSGAGMRVKILDAWCSGLPVVSTGIGAEGIDTTDGENILLADSNDEFAEAVIRVLQHSNLAKSIGSAGRETVERLYDWREAYRAWDAVYH